MAEREKKSEERNNGGLRITTWNVNGIRNPFGYQPWRENRTFPAMFDTLESDIVIMQELKIQRKDLRDDMVLVDGWDCFFSLPKHKKGYSGVGIYTRQATCVPIRAEEGILGVLSLPGKTERFCDLPSDQSIGGYPTSLQLLDIGVDPVILDSEGRCVVLEFPAFVIFGVYSPANSNGLRDDFRAAFLKALDARIRNLHAAGKRVILTGDLNVSRDEKDSARAEEDNRKEGVTHAEYVSTPNRRIFNQLIDGGEVIGQRDAGRKTAIFSDLCREFHPNRVGMYTHWDQKLNARPGNCGSRIDFILSSIDMRSWFSHADIQEGLMGSDHCPVYAIFQAEVDVDGHRVNIRDMMNPKGVFENGERQRVITTKDLLPFSGKLLPEFDKRRTIKDMFRAASKAASPMKPVITAITKSPEKSPEKPPVKRQKVGQQTLQGFFPPKLAKEETLKQELQVVQTSQDSKEIEQSPQYCIASPDSKKTMSPVQVNKTLSETKEEKFIDPFRSRSEWGQLFTKREVPRCEHGEPTKSLQTKVNGVNKGRHFYICSRPLGPSGDKEVGTAWRCRTFIWASER